MLCLGFLRPGWLDSKDSSLLSWSLQVLFNICLVQKTRWLMLYPVLLVSLWLQLLVPALKVSLILSVNSGTHAQV